LRSFFFFFAATNLKLHSPIQILFSAKAAFEGQIMSQQLIDDLKNNLTNTLLAAQSHCEFAISSQILYQMLTNIKY